MFRWVVLILPVALSFHSLLTWFHAEANYYYDKTFPSSIY